MLVPPRCLVANTVCQELAAHPRALQQHTAQLLTSHVFALSSSHPCCSQREAKRQQKAAEAAKKAAEAEKKAAEAAKRKEATEAAKAGFGSTTQLHKAQNVFKVGTTRWSSCIGCSVPRSMHACQALLWSALRQATLI